MPVGSHHTAEVVECRIRRAAEVMEMFEEDIRRIAAV
jgi:hypothetical protein